MGLELLESPTDSGDESARQRGAARLHMSTNTKRAAFVVAVFLTFAVYRVASDLIASGGLGGESAGEMIRGFLVPSAIVGVLFVYWRHRRASKVQAQNPAPRP